jgi:hypothetical protein
MISVSYNFNNVSPETWLSEWPFAFCLCAFQRMSILGIAYFSSVDIELEVSLSSESQ